MPTQKDLKRLVRSRMKKTGESYSTARMHVTRTRPDRPDRPPTPGYAALAGMSDAADARTRGKWLPADVVVRKATPPRSVRMTWPDGTSVEVWITAKGRRCSVGLQHTRLASKADQAARKVFWAERLAALERLRGR